ncbi:MAG TPA: hypothetical protein VLG10_10210 [Methylomirabilota bacterium]|nr:hypothetical protein [Methylomirabilota bacterium]
MRWLAVILALLPLAGCTAAFDVAGRDWTRDNTSHPQITLDQTECARDAYEAGDTPDLLLGGLLDVLRLGIENGSQAHAYRECMTSRGYEEREG